MSRVGWTVAMLAGIVLAAVVATSAEEPAVRHGRELYQLYCSSCHGGDGAGTGPVASALRTRPADLRRIAARRGGVFPDEEVAAYIDGRRDLTAHGTREMPVWGRVLSEKLRRHESPESAVAAEIRLLVAHLRSLQLAETSEATRP